MTYLPKLGTKPIPMFPSELPDGIEQVDFVYVTGDAYVDHPSFGTAIISRILEDAGFTVGIIAQPEWKTSFKPTSKMGVTRFGRPRLGFAVGRLIVDIEKFLGYNNITDAVLVGAGGLGRAFLGYEGFKSNGLNVVAGFDVNEKLIGTEVAGKRIYALDELGEFVKKHDIRIGIITVPKHAAQEVLNYMVEAGIKAVWNFAPAPLRVPKDIVLKTEDLAASLAILAGKLYRTQE